MKKKSREQKVAPSASKKVRKGDTVIVLSGASRGRTGVVLSSNESGVVVQGLNVRKKHVKATQAQPKGAIVELEKPIHISNVCVCVDGKPVKLKVRTSDAGDRELYYMNGEQAVTYRSIKKQ
jgi:large subunit ribosomal protein L24